MPHPPVSIIVPIYKVEPYLRRCLDSLINQTYTNLEIILIDDGSPDCCPQICDKYAVKDNRIKVIHKKNGGLSDARNTGLDICKGEYISFVDSDDWVSKNYIERLLNLAIKEDAGIVIGENIRTDGNSRSFKGNTSIKAYTSNEALHHLFSQNHIAFTVSWGKLYKRTLFRTIRFPVGKFHEDEFTTYILFYNTNKIIYTSEVLYYYYQRGNSIVRTSHPWDVLEFLEQRYLFFKERNVTDVLPYLLPPLGWQLLCSYWYAKEKKQLEFDTFRTKLCTYINDFQFVKVPLFHKFFLNIFSKHPELYLLYRKQPFVIRKKF